MAANKLIKVTPGVGRGIATEYTLVGKGKQRESFCDDAKRKPADYEKENLTPRKGKQERRKKANPGVAPFNSIQSRDHTHSHSGRGESDCDFQEEEGHAEFERIFRMWPNPEKDHDLALRAWKNAVLRKGHDPRLVLKRAKQWCRHWEETNPKLIPYLGKWLKEGMWDDAPDDSDWKAGERMQALLTADLDERFAYGVADPDSPD